MISLKRADGFKKWPSTISCLVCGSLSFYFFLCQLLPFR
ncbi:MULTISPECIES: hypothetical protein [Bacillaceae]|nr:MULTISPECIES: hypothetical protein [Bacillaceae]URT73373.1 hypothetical protein NAF01_13995 [Cytobacillus firmus]